MKKFAILNLFPEVFKSYLSKSIPKIAQEKKLVEVELINIREFPTQEIDDYAFGGGPGMVLKIEPIVNALRKHNLLDYHIILLSPKGEKFSHAKAEELSKLEKVALICGYYEGVDQRISNYINQEISIGDYVLSSGELPALVLLDAVIRLIPGVIKKESLENESFNQYLLDFSVYTRPKVFEGHSVPEILFSGNHEKIRNFRYEERILNTKKYRPDLYKLFKSKKK